ncbi:MAG: hypothetical protein BWY74_00437 [Firmicutes bacterium ADurb.Bin419]|nr:MAG: hypothetical protein BWY74_00437 [Firmicutes bacterium ADurb.Bin419]
MRKLILLGVLVLILISSVSCNKTEGVLDSRSPINSPSNNLNENTEDMRKSITGDNDYLEIIGEGDKLVLKNDSGYLYCTKTSSLGILESIATTVSEYQIFLSDDGKMVYYCTNSSSVEGRLNYYDVKNNKYGDLLKEMGIHIEGYVGLAAYKSDKIAILVGNYDENKSKIETDTLVEIDLKGKKHRIIKIPFIPHGAMIYKGLSYFGDNIGILCSSKGHVQEEYTQGLVILGEDGEVVNEVTIPVKDMVCNISTSPDGSKFTYQTGNTPMDLNLYDIKDGSNKVLFSPELLQENWEIICVSAMWGKESGNLYYVTCDTSNESEGRYQLNKVGF